MEPLETLTPPLDASEWIRLALRRYEAPLVRYAFGITGDLESARDVVQDTFLRLCSEDPAALEGRLAPWLFTVCRRRALDVLRRSNRMTSLSETELENTFDAGPPPDVATDNREQATTAMRLLALLPSNQRDVVRLKFQSQLSYEDIAAVTSLSVGNVGFLLHTALKTLRTRMANLESCPPAAAQRP